MTAEKSARPRPEGFVGGTAVDCSEVLPRLPTMLAGRRSELDRLSEGLVSFPVALVYGVAGIGKTALAVATVKRGARAVVYTMARDVHLSVLLDQARRSFPGRSVVELDGVHARLLDLLARLDAHKAVWLLDDLHMLALDERKLLVETACERLERGRLLATSRERVPLGVHVGDHVEILLEPIPRQAAQRLWSAMDKLHGTVEGFEAAFALSRGNPLVLRSAHAGQAPPLLGTDPLGSCLDALSEEEFQLAQALAVAMIRLPVEVLVDALSGLDVAEALSSLHRRLVAEVDGGGRWGAHDLFREAILARGSQDALCEVHVRLAGALCRYDLGDPVLRAHAVVHHYHAARAPHQAALFLAGQAPVLVRSGAAGELVAMVDSLPGEARTPELDVARGWCLMRVGEVREALQVLRRYGSAPISVEHRLALAQAEAMVGRPVLAEQLLLELPTDIPSPRLALRAERVWAALRVVQGRTAEARGRLEAVEHLAASPMDRARLAMLRALSYWMEGRYADAQGPVHQANRIFEEAEIPPGSRRTYITSAPILANLGLFDEAEDVLRAAGLDVAMPEDVVPFGLQVEHAIVVAERGDRLRALRLLGDALHVLLSQGQVLAAWWAGLQLGRTLLMLGRRSEGMDVLGKVLRETEEAGAMGLHRAAWLETALDPLSLLQWRPSPESLTNPGLMVRHAVTRALQAFARGQVSLAGELLGSVPKAIGEPGLGFERAVAGLTESLVHDASGRRDDALVAYERAGQEARREQVDPGLLQSIRRQVVAVAAAQGSEAPVEPIVSDARGPIEGEAVLDARRHVLTDASCSVSLARRVVLRRILYALAQRPGKPLALEDLAHAAWGVPYHPLQHDNGLRVNLRRLRSLLAETSLQVETVEQGYRLLAPRGLVFIPPDVE